jgi:hypothetical protein
MSKYINEYVVTADQKGELAKNGFIKLSGLLKKELVKSLTNFIDIGYESVNDDEEDFFSRQAYDVGNNDTLIRSIYEDHLFKKVINDLVDERLFFTQGIFFELKKNVSRGFPWHFGYLSFNFVMPYDMAYTIWIPLDVICSKKQGGGMAYIPQDLFSATEDAKKFALARDLLADEFSEEEFENMNNFGLCERLFDSVCQEDDFALGDVFIFNRFVWHKSVPLRDGPLAKRRAYVMRLVSENASYNRNLLEKSSSGVSQYSTYGFRFEDIKHGERIVDSKFSNDII